MSIYCHPKAAPALESESYMKILLLLMAPLAADAPPIRIELVTGGHAHEISFDAVFEGNRDFRINVNPHPGAFHSDMRKSTDVLVLYDMADADGENGRTYVSKVPDLLDTYASQRPSLENIGNTSAD